MLTVNHCSCRKGRPVVAFSVLLCSSLAGLAVPVRARAQLTGSASASAQYGSSSNLFASDTANGQSGANGTVGAVSTYGYGVAADGNYKWSRQSLYATATFNQSDYQEHLDLNHYEYSIGTGLRWNLAEFLSGSFAVTRSKAMVPFLDLTGSASGESLSLLTAQTETMQIALKLSSEWALAGSASTSSSTQSTAGASDGALRATSGTASLQYSGFGPFTSGITATYSSGDSGGTGVARDPPYVQTSAGVLANYKLSRTSFNGTVTYSRRSFSGDAASGEAAEAVSGLTGSLGFSDQLTEKTSYSINISRSINTQYLNLGSEVDTSAGLGASWQATHKISVSLSYAFDYRDFPAQVPGQTQAQAGQTQTPTGAVTANTIDRQQSVALTIGYHPVAWLSIGTYGNVQTRNSNTAGRNFDSTAYGVSLSATVGNGGGK